MMIEVLREEMNKYLKETYKNTVEENNKQTNKQQIQDLKVEI